MTYEYTGRRTRPYSKESETCSPGKHGHTRAYNLCGATSELGYRVTAERSVRQASCRDDNGSRGSRNDNDIGDCERLNRGLGSILGRCGEDLSVRLSLGKRLNGRLCGKSRQCGRGGKLHGDGLADESSDTILKGTFVCGDVFGAAKDSTNGI
jgi:hypothetical protein